MKFSQDVAKFSQHLTFFIPFSGQNEGGTAHQWTVPHFLITKIQLFYAKSKSPLTIFKECFTPILTLHTGGVLSTKLCAELKENITGGYTCIIACDERAVGCIAINIA